MNKCDKCPYFKDQFGNFVMCIKISRFIDWEYWNNIEPEDCPLKENVDCENRSNKISQQKARDIND